MKKVIRLSVHAKKQARLRGATEAEVIEAVRQGRWEHARRNKQQAHLTFPFGGVSPINGKRYATKTVEPIFADEPDEVVVVTVKVSYGGEIVEDNGT